MSEVTTDQLKHDLDEFGNMYKQILLERKEAIEALINIRFEVGMAVVYLGEILNAPLVHNRGLLRKIEQHLHTSQEHLGNVLGDVPGEEMEASNE